MGFQILFDTDFLDRLAKLQLASPRLSSWGEDSRRQTFRIGTGLEFAQHRPYTPGDDFRYIDWNVYARLRELHLKTFESEEHLSVEILLDTSQSMLFGQPSKAEQACLLAASLAYVALAARDRLTITTFKTGLESRFAATGEKQSLNGLKRFFSSLEFGGRTSLHSVFDTFVRQVAPGSLVFILSDFWNADDLGPALATLASARLSPVGVQVHHPFEIDPQSFLTGHSQATLIDSETTDRLTLPLTRSLFRLYREEYQRSQKSVKAIFERNGGRLEMVRTDERIEEVLFERFRKVQIVR